MPRLKPEQFDFTGFEHRLKSLMPEDLGVSEYNRIYLKKHLEEFSYTLELSVQILDQGIRETTKDIKDLTLIEIGGGTGFISLLARWMGFGKVIYTDSFSESCRDFGIIARELHLKADEIHCITAENLQSVQSLQPDLIVSRDVIEHIYKPEAFIRNCIQTWPGSVSVHNTSANPHNLFKKYYFRNIHRKDELEGNPDQLKPGDSKQSFLAMRRDYLHNFFPEMNSNQREKLAGLSRGLNFNDLKIAAEKVMSGGEFPVPPAHPTNTCDPATGNWTEHLLSTEQYRSMTSGTGAVMRFVWAGYNEHGNRGIKSLVQTILNRFIRSNIFTKYLSPAMVIVIRPGK